MNKLSLNHLLLAFSTCFPVFVACVELMGINLAMHDIGRVFHVVSHTYLTWLIAAYTLTNAGFYIVLGRMSDYIGHRNMLLLGCFTMAVWSLLGVFSWNYTVLIIVRALQGLSSASIIVSSLSLLKNDIDNDRQALLTLWSSISGVGLAIGPFIGGILVRLFNWEGIFYWSFVLCLISLVFVWNWTPKKQNKVAHFSGDLIGALLLFIFITALMLLLTEKSLLSKVAIIISWVTAPISLILFLIREYNLRRPLLEFSLLKKPYYLLATFVGVALYYSLYCYLFIFSLYFQNLGWGSLKTGTYLAVAPVVFVLGTYLIGRYIIFERCRIFFQFGSLIGVVSFLLLMLGGQDHAIGYLLGAILFGIAYSFYSQPSLFLASKECEDSNVGAGIGMLFTFRWIAGSFGVFVSAILMKNTQMNTFNLINPCLVVLAIFSFVGLVATWIFQGVNHS